MEKRVLALALQRGVFPNKESLGVFFAPASLKRCMSLQATRRCIYLLLVERQDIYTAAIFFSIFKLKVSVMIVS